MAISKWPVVYLALFCALFLFLLDACTCEATIADGKRKEAEVESTLLGGAKGRKLGVGGFGDIKDIYILAECKQKIVGGEIKWCCCNSCYPNKPRCDIVCEFPHPCRLSPPPPPSL